MANTRDLALLLFAHILFLVTLTSRLGVLSIRVPIWQLRHEVASRTQVLPRPGPRRSLSALGGSPVLLRVF